jgi:hypothetical protein
MYEYGTLKPVKATLRSGKRKHKGENETNWGMEMSQ